MCGIVGIISKYNSKLLEINLNSLSHRGPDSRGSWKNSDETAILGHTRLSIIDLTQEANQPFHSIDGRHVIVFNGEIYNYQQLAKKLSLREGQSVRVGKEIDHDQRQEQFRTKGDTEVLLAYYKKWGKDCLPKLNGMFVFAIYDKMEGKLFMARDAMGIKPLFYYQDEYCLAFASEIKALTELPEIRSKLTVNQNAIADFLQLGYIPAPGTIYNEIRKFPQGHFAEIDSNLDTSFHQWWSLDEHIEQEIYSDELSATARLTELIENSVKSRLVADVPVGSFLSGGIDSSLVSAIAKKYANKPFKTFTIGFDEQKFNESKYARKVASAIGSEHYEHILREQDAMDLLLEIIPTYDEPYADSSAIPTMLVSKLAREEVKVVLTGDGGDELFHGYGSYKWAERLSSKSKRAVSNLISMPFRQFGDSRIKRIGELMNTNGSGLRSHIFSQEQYFFSNKEVAGLLQVEPPSKEEFYDDPVLKRGLTSTEYQALFDLKYYLPDDLLTKVDRASMKYGLEARVPLLDRNLVKFALNLDPKLKRNEKYLLKQVLYKYLPASYFDRPKWGFGIPLGKWLGGEMSWLIDKYLEKGVVEEAGFIKFTGVSDYISRFRKGETYLYNRIWNLILLHWWQRSNSN